MNYFGARYYDSDLGRWTSVDPLAYKRLWLSPYQYVQNNPLLLLDPTGMLDNGDDDESLWSKMSRWIGLSGNNSNSENPGTQMTESLVKGVNESLNNSVAEVREDLEGLPVKVGEGADIVSEGSNYVALVGIVAAPFTGGSSLTLTGYALTVGTYAEVTSAFAKGIDALAFNGSNEAFERQAGIATLSTIGGFGVNKLFGRVVTKTSSSVSGPAYRSTTTGRFVSNAYGFSLQAANDAARFALTIGF